jgi:hypothetical protein
MVCGEIRGDVHVDDVAVLEHASVGNAVAHDLVHARANALGIAVVTERRRACTVPNRVVVHETIDVVRGHPGLEMLANHQQRIGGKFAGCAHPLQVFGAHQLDSAHADILLVGRP